MKPSLNLLLCAGFLLIGTGLFIASFILQRDYTVANTSLKKLAQAIQGANRVEVLTLSTTPTTESQETFKAAGHEVTYFINGTHTLDKNATKELKDILADHLLTTEFGAACHTPGQVLRLYSDSTILLEASLCLKCSNIQFYVYPFVPATVTIVQNDQSDMTLPKLEAFLKAVKER